MENKILGFPIQKNWKISCKVLKKRLFTILVNKKSQRFRVQKDTRVTFPEKNLFFFDHENVFVSINDKMNFWKSFHQNSQLENNSY